MNLAVVVLTCDKSDQLLPGFAWLFNKYWDPLQDVTVFHFRPPPSLPSNFSPSKQLAPKEVDPWSDGVRVGVESLQCDYLCLLLDDYWFLEKIDLEKVHWLATRALKKGWDKIDLSRNTFINGSKEAAGGLIRPKAGARWQISTQPAIWRKGFLLEYLKPGLNPWNFERRGSSEARRRNDLKIRGTTEGVCNYANIYWRGQVNPNQLDRLNDEDRLSLRDNGYLDFLDTDKTL